MDLATLLIIVFFAALVTCLATGLGAVPFLFAREISQRWEGWMEGAAGGMMGAASVYLIIEGLTYDGGSWEYLEVVLGGLVGLLFFLLAGRWLDEHEEFDVGGLRKAGGLTALLIVGAMTIHSLPEGVAVGVGFGVANPDIGQGLGFGSAISTAIAFHNIPEGLAISVALRSRGLSVGKCALWSIVSSVPQPLAAPIAAWLAWIFVPMLPAGMGFAAGAMLALVAMELGPNAWKRVGPTHAIGSAVVGALLMTGLSVAITSIG
ncbi:MAG: ZIP family metal transporter [Phycisphaerales bacterium]